MQKLFWIVMVLISRSLLVPMIGYATDAKIAKELEAAGATVTEVDGAVTELTFRDSSELGDAQWKAIGQLTHLEKLTAYGRAHGLNDTTVVYLTKLERLESLSTDGAQLSDAGLEQLAKLHNLRSASFFHLSFRKQGFTGVGFAAWKSMPNLERLTVAGMSMGDTGFAEIAKIASLRELRSWHTYRTEASNVEIAKLPKLQTLKLGQRLPRGKEHPPSLTDASIATLATIDSLERLEIGEARFTLEALRQLKTLPKLKRLKIDRAEISLADVERLRVNMPDVQIDFEPLTDEQRSRLESYLK